MNVYQAYDASFRTPPMAGRTEEPLFNGTRRANSFSSDGELKLFTQSPPRVTRGGETCVSGVIFLVISVAEYHQVHGYFLC